jgi:methylamine utilization protein MauE
MMALLVWLFGCLAGGQLLVAASSKVSGYAIYKRQLAHYRLGRFPFTAPALLGLEVVLAVGAVTLLPSFRLVLGGLATFYLLGSYHRGQVAKTPQGGSCLCTAGHDRTSWADVVANLTMVAGASTLLLAGSQPSVVMSAIGATVAVVFVALWGRAEVTVRRKRVRIWREGASRDAGAIVA